MSRKLLIETHTVNISPTQINENVSKENGNIVVEGILATAEVKNGNGRYYSRKKFLEARSKELRQKVGILEGLKLTISHYKRNHK